MRDARDLATRVDELLTGLGVPSLEDADALLAGLDAAALELATTKRGSCRNATPPARIWPCD